MDILFYMAGGALLSHFALCVLLQRRLREDPAALHELFAAPNERVIGQSRFQLLRARYYLLWRPMPKNLGTMSRGQVVLFNLAKTTGLLVIVGFLGFLALSVVQATK
jgi:hypothetical protein